MRHEAPIKTGLLRRNIYAKFKGLSGEVAPNLKITPYALHVHKRNKFIVRTSDRMERPVELVFKKAVNNILKHLITK